MSRYILSSIGVSEKEDALEAAVEASTRVKEYFDDRNTRPKILLIFCTDKYLLDAGRALEEIQRIFGGDIPQVGGVVPGFNANGREYMTLYMPPDKIRHGMVVVGLESSYFDVSVGIGQDVDKNPFKAGRDAITSALDNNRYKSKLSYLAVSKTRSAIEQLKLRPFNSFLITPGITEKHFLKNQDIVKGFESVAGGAVRVCGGGVGSYDWSERSVISRTSKQFFNGKVFEESVICVTFGTDLKFGYSTHSGFKSTGKGFFVTKVEDNILLEANGKPAAEVVTGLYQENIPEKFEKIPDSALADHPLGVVDPHGVCWPRIIVGITDEGGVVLCMSGTGEGDPLMLLEGTRELHLKSIEDASKDITDDAGTDKIGFVMFFSCSMRAVVMGDDYAREAARLGEVFNDSDVFGIMCIGGIGSFKGGTPMGFAETFTAFGIADETIVSE
jgi:hypothetical protein